MTQNSDTFLGFEKKQIPLLALIAAFGGILIAFGGIIIALQMGTRSDMNANHAATQADIHALSNRVDTLQTVMTANDNALRAEMNSNINALRTETSAEINDLDSRIDVLSVEAAETNARIVNIESRIENIERRVENIERSLPDYASVYIRLAELEREQARIAELEREQARLSELVADLVSAE